MRPDKLSELLQDIDETLISRAAKRRKANRALIIRTVALCACLALVMTVTIHFALKKPEIFVKNDSAADNISNNETVGTDGGTDSDMPSHREEPKDDVKPGDSSPLHDKNEGDNCGNDESSKQNSSTQQHPSDDEDLEENTGTTASPVTQADDPYPFFTENIQFTCGGYSITQIYDPVSLNYGYYVTNAATGEKVKIRQGSTLRLSEQAVFDKLPILPYSSKTNLSPMDDSALNRLEDPAYDYSIFRGSKSGMSTQHIELYTTASEASYRMTRTAHTPVTVTKSLYGQLKQNEQVLLAENAAVVEYEGQKHIFCAEGYPPIKKDTEYIFIVAKTRSKQDGIIYRPAEPMHFCIFEITDEVRAASSAEELSSMSDAEKTIYQKYYYDTL